MTKNLQAGNICRRTGKSVRMDIESVRKEEYLISVEQTEKQSHAAAIQSYSRPLQKADTVRSVE